MRLAVAIVALTACATAPVQEMSDARLAIRSAEAVGALQHSPQALMEAQRLLQEAQTHLESGTYEDARQYALDARQQAIKARNVALRKNNLFRSNPAP